MSVRVEVETKETMQRPAVDLYFYSSSGRMIYAQSDRFVDHPQQSTHHWEFEFEFENNGFVSDYMTIDVGFRYSSSTRYLGLWRSVAAVALGPVPPGHSHGRECPVAVPCAVDVRGIAA